MRETILTATVTLDDFHAEPLTLDQAIALMDNQGFLETTIALDVDTFVEMRSDDYAFEANEDIYSRLAALQVVDGDPYDASYKVRFFDPETNLVYVSFATGLRESLESRGIDLIDDDSDADIADEG